MTVLIVTAALCLGDTSTAFRLGDTSTLRPLPLGPLNSIHVPLEVTWQDISDYLTIHASVRDPLTEDMLRLEAEAGEKTWVSCAATGGGGQRMRPLDGPGAGWPALSRVIRFPTEAERNIATAMIDDYTASNRSGLLN